MAYHKKWHFQTLLEIKLFKIWHQTKFWKFWNFLSLKTSSALCQSRQIHLQYLILMKPWNLFLRKLRNFSKNAISIVVSYYQALTTQHMLEGSFPDNRIKPSRKLLFLLWREHLKERSWSFLLKKRCDWMKMTTLVFCLKSHLLSTGIILKVQALNLGIESIFQCWLQLNIKDNKLKRGVPGNQRDSNQDKPLM